MLPRLSFIKQSNIGARLSLKLVLKQSSAMYRKIAILVQNKVTPAFSSQTGHG